MVLPTVPANALTFCETSLSPRPYEPATNVLEDPLAEGSA